MVLDTFSFFRDLLHHQVLGRGNFGAVHLGTHKRTGEKVAIKVIRKPSNQGPSTHREEQVVLNEIAILKEVCGGGCGGHR